MPLIAMIDITDGLIFAGPIFFRNVITVNNEGNLYI